MYLVVAENPIGWMPIWSPLTVFLLLRIAIGVPVVEKKYEYDNEYQVYVRETSCIFFWPVRREKRIQVEHIHDESSRIV